MAHYRFQFWVKYSGSATIKNYLKKVRDKQKVMNRCIRAIKVSFIHGKYLWAMLCRICFMGLTSTIYCCNTLIRKLHYSIGIIIVCKVKYYQRKSSISLYLLTIQNDSCKLWSYKFIHINETSYKITLSKINRIVRKDINIIKNHSLYYNIMLRVYKLLLELDLEPK